MSGYAATAAMSFTWLEALLVLLVALFMVTTAAIKISHWLDRRRNPEAEPLRPVEFSGKMRSALLDRVWAQRIENTLERSLELAAEMRLGLRSVPDLVTSSSSTSTTEAGDEVANIVTAYEEASHQLLIVGGPGSGKTTEALKLMRHLLEVAQSDPAAPIPELFPLASWARERKPLLSWLADQLQLRHGWPHPDARSLIRNHHVVPFLDGLDEVAADHREACLDEVNSFLKIHRDGPLVLCSRLAEYREGSRRVRLGGAVSISPLEENQIQGYLAGAGPSWDPVRTQIRTGSSSLPRELFTTPLMLSIAVLSYQDQDPMELFQSHDTASVRDYLWPRYLSTMMTRSYGPARDEGAGSKPPYTEEQVRRWSGWLAHEMWSREETELWPHEWSGPAGLSKSVTLAAAGILGLALGMLLGVGGSAAFQLAAGLIVALFFMVVVGVSNGRILRPDPAYRVPFNRGRLAGSVIDGIAGGLGLGLAYGGLRTPESITNQSALTFALVAGLTFAMGSVRTLLPLRRDRSGMRRTPAVEGLLVLLLATPFIILLATASTPWVKALGGGVIFAVFIGRPIQPAMAYLEGGRSSRLVAAVIRRFFVGSFVALASALAALMLYALLPFLNGILIGLLVGIVGELLFGLAFALVSFGSDRERLAPRSPRQLINDSARIGLLFGLVFGIAAGVVAGIQGARYFSGMHVGVLLGLGYGITIGLIFGLSFGLNCQLFHLVFRLWLRLHDYGPFRWLGFLEWASDHQLLRSTGASYEWVHIELRNYLAREHLQHEALLSAGHLPPSSSALEAS